ncbi:MAG: hypothetical protein PHV20_04070 [Bacteroidales bacterium]|nr:hypothetical protein [Bacteroidales bacterium]
MDIIDNVYHALFQANVKYQKFYKKTEKVELIDLNQTCLLTHFYLTFWPKAICLQNIPYAKDKFIDTIIIDNKSVVYIESKKSIDKKNNGYKVGQMGLELQSIDRTKITNNLCVDKNEYVIYLGDITLEDEWPDGLKGWKDLQYYISMSILILNERPKEIYIFKSSDEIPF